MCSAGLLENSSRPSLSWERRCEGYLRRKERSCHTWPQHPLPIPLLWLQGRGEGIWKQGGMLSLSEWVRWESCFSFCLYCSLSKLTWTGKKLNSFSPCGTWFAPDSDWWGISLSLSPSITLFLLTRYPHPLGQEEWALGSPVGSVHQSPMGAWPQCVVPELLPCLYTHRVLSPCATEIPACDHVQQHEERHQEYNRSSTRQLIITKQIQHLSMGSLWPASKWWGPQMAGEGCQ